MATTSEGTATRESAIANAASLRQQMNQILCEISEGKFSIDSIFEIDGNAALNQLYVLKILEKFAGIGKVRARSGLDVLKISHKCRFSSLESRQREALIKEFAQ